MDREQMLADVTAFHDRMWELYAKAMATCQTAEMEAVMVEDHMCYFGFTGKAVELCDRETCIQGLRQSFSKPSTARFRMEGRQIRLRGADEAVVAFEKVMENESKVLIRFFCIECYRLIDGEWRLFRETVEHAGA